MKTPLLLFLAMILNAFPFPARGQGHSLTRLWDRYEQPRTSLPFWKR